MFFRNRWTLLSFFFAAILPLPAQNRNLSGNAGPVILTLEQTITLAVDSSLEAFRSKNAYMSSYWEYRTFRAERLPSLMLNLTPGQYNRTIIKRYDSESKVDIYRPQQAFEAYGGLSVAQNFDLLGGTFFLNTNMDYLRNFGDNTYTQYRSVPVRIGYQQDLIGYNAFKWKKKIEPLKYEKAKNSWHTTWKIPPDWRHPIFLTWQWRRRSMIWLSKMSHQRIRFTVSDSRGSRSPPSRRPTS